MKRTDPAVDELVRAVRGMSVAERSAYLARTFPDDPERRVEVESYMRHDDATSTIATASPDPSVPDSDATVVLEHQPQIGPVVGRYRIIREIGHGGMGVVFLARDEQFHRRVALKVLKRGMDSEDILRRFELERQLLAALNHPGIARLYDAGETDAGLPYFVMEYVEGLDVEQYCDVNRLTVEERLELFQRVCAAVHHAHQNLVVHRDLKPGNILVTNEGQPKLLDFGIAKVISPEFSVFAGDPTLPEMRVMTPQYASPEQVRGDTVSTATDVYALGVLLYELLCGHRPYHIRTRIRAELERVICEEEPERPSTAISRIEEDRTDLDDATTAHTLTPESVSRTRGGRPDRLRRRLAGDVDNIVLMAMRKEPNRRYPSAEQLAADIERHLTGQPVIARRDTLSYRMSKFVRRNRGGVAAAGFIVLSLAAGVVVASWGWAEAREAQVAELEQRVAAEAQRDRADRRFDQVRSLARVFMFDFHDAVQELDGSVPAREMLVTKSLEYLDALREEAGDHPDLMRELASAYDRVGDIRGGVRNPSLGDTGGALDSYRAALEIREEVVTDTDDDEVRKELSTSHLRIGDMMMHRGDATGALDEYRQALRLREVLAEAAPHDVDTRRDVAVALSNLGAALVATGDSEAARAYYTRSLDTREELVADRPDDQRLQRELSSASLRMGGRLEEAGDAGGALAHYERAVAIRDRLVAANPDSSRARRDLAVARYFVGRSYLRRDALDEAAPHLQHYLEAAQTRVRDNPTDARAQRDLASAYEIVGGLEVRRGDANAAAAHYEGMRGVLEPLIGRDPANTQYQTLLAVSHERLAEIQAESAEYGEAVATVRKALDLIEPVAKADGSDVRRQASYARVLRKLGSWLAADDQPQEARRRLDAAWDKYQTLLKLRPEDVEIRAESAATAHALSGVLAARQERQGALAYAEQALELTDDRDPAWLRELALALAEAGSRERAAVVAREALDLLGDADHAKTRTLRATLEDDLRRYSARD